MRKFLLAQISTYLVFFVGLIYTIENSEKVIVTVVLMIIFTIIMNTQLKHYHNMLSRVNKINVSIERMLNGDDEFHIPIYLSDNDIDIEYNFNRLIKKFKSMSFKLEEKNKKIDIMTENMNSSIVIINKDGIIRYINKMFIKTFKNENIVNKEYKKLENDKLSKIIEDCFIYESTIKKKFSYSGNYYDVLAVPIFKDILFNGCIFIIHDITELKRYENLQKEFLANASHELRSPIAAIKGCSEILISGAKNDETVLDEFLDIIHKETDRMEKLVKDLMLISKYDYDHLQIEMKEVNLHDLTANCISSVKMQIKNKKHVVLNNCNQNVTIIGDYEKLKTMVMNLLLNAINYTHVNGEIEIKTDTIDNKINLSIKDNGIGIPKKDLDQIFSRFYRVDKARSRDTGGTGLGLSIVKSVLDNHDAKIKVESEENVGTKFTVSFPKINKD